MRVHVPCPVPTPGCPTTATLLAVLVVALAAHRGLGNDVDLSVSAKVPPGQTPALTVKVNKALKSCTVQVRSAVGQVDRTEGPKEAGGELVFSLPHTTSGRVTWDGALAVVFADGAEGRMPLRFPTEVLAPFRFDVRDVRLDDRRLTVVSEHNTAKVDLEVYGDDGAPIAAVSQSVDAVAAGAPIGVTWIPNKDGPVLRLHIVVYDTDGMFQSMDLFPYNIAIPHEEVQFETGKHDVRTSEEPKLEAALAELKKAVERYGTAAQVEGATIRLFVAGHTDTVGAASSNRGLSERRARAIAAWFQRKGVTVPIYARGFGEDVLRVQTADETDEPRNRRVDYDVGVNGPTGSIAGWTRIP